MLGRPARVCGPVLRGGRKVRTPSSGSAVLSGCHARQSFHSSSLLPLTRHFPSLVLSPTPNHTRLSLRIFGNALTSAHRETSRGLASSAPVAHGVPTTYNPPALALYPHASKDGPEFMWSVEGGGSHFGG